MKNPSTKTKIRKARKKMAKHPLSQTPEEIVAAYKESEAHNANVQASINYQHTIEGNFSKDMLTDDKLSSEILYNACMRVAAKLAFDGNRGVPWFMGQARMAYHDYKERVRK